MTAEKGCICERMAFLTVWCQVEFRVLRIEALRDIFVVARSPLFWVVVKKRNLEVHPLVSSNFEFFRGALGQHGVLPEDDISSVVDRGFFPQRFFKALHCELELLLDFLVAASLLELVVIDLLTLSVPGLKGKLSVDFFQKLLLNGKIAVHVDVLHHIVNADLGCGHCSGVDCNHIREHCLFNQFIATDSAVSVTTLLKED